MGFKTKMKNKRFSSIKNCMPGFYNRFFSLNPCHAYIWCNEHLKATIESIDVSGVY